MDDTRHVRNVATDLILTVLTCGLFYIYVQAKQLEAVNEMIGEPKYDFASWLLFSIVTCGLYHIYHEYRKSGDIVDACGMQDSNEQVITVLLSAFGLSFVADAILQGHINRFFGSDAL